LIVTISNLERKTLPPFGLFRKPKKEEQPQQQTQQQEEKPAAEPPHVTEDKPTIEASLHTTPPEKIENEVKTYLKAMPLRELADLENVKNEVKNGNIVILRITPLASKSIEDVKQAVDQLYTFAESVNGDIARLGEERVVICPKTVRIWREKTPVQDPPLPTAA
jgi:SepF-like predicted cell division protein (DUF552 family)